MTSVWEFKQDYARIRHAHVQHLGYSGSLHHQRPYWLHAKAAASREQRQRLQGRERDEEGREGEGARQGLKRKGARDGEGEGECVDG